MPGQRLTARMFDAIEAAGGEDLVFPMLANGETVTSVCAFLVANYPELEELSRGVLSTWCNRPNRKERYLEARREGAAVFAEETKDIADLVAPDKGATAKAKLQIDTRKWLAGKLDHDAWGDKNQQGGVININQLHLTAVKRIEAEEDRRALERVDGNVIEGELVETGDTSWLDEDEESWLE